MAAALEPNNRFPFSVITFLSATFFHPKANMEVDPLEGQQISSGSAERTLKRPRVDEGQDGGPEVATEQCGRHPSLYLEDGNVILRCGE